MVASEGVPSDTSRILETKQRFAVALLNIPGIYLALGVFAVDNTEIVVCTCYKGMDFTVASLMRCKDLVEGLKCKSILSTLWVDT